MRTALITGITGQDGSHLADLLLAKGYKVHGMVRRASTDNFFRIDHILNRVELHQGDLLDSASLVTIMENTGWIPTVSVSRMPCLTAADRRPCAERWKFNNEIAHGQDPAVLGRCRL